MDNNCFYTKYGLGDLVRVRLSGSNRLIDLHIDVISITYGRDSDFRYYYQSSDFPGFVFDNQDIICYVKEDH